MKNMPNRIGLVLVGLLILFFCGCEVVPTQSEQITQVTQASMLVKGTGTRETVSLPDDWLYVRPGKAGKASYFIEVPDKAIQSAKRANDLVALYISRASLNSDVYIGGSLLSHAHSESDRYWYTPIFIRIPPALLEANANLIRIDVNVYQLYRGGLGSVWFGPAAELEPSYSWAYFWRVDASRISAMIALLTSGYVLLFWVGVPSHQEFAWYGFASLVMALRHTNFFWTDPPLSFELYSTLTLGGLWLAFALVALFAVRFTKLHRSWVTWFLLAYGFFPFVAMGLFGNALYGVVAIYGLIGVGIFLVIAIALILRWSQTKDLEVLVVGSVLVMYMMSLVKDLQVLTGKDFDAFYVSHFVMVFLCLAVSWLMARRQSISRGMIERLGQKLTQRLQESQLALETSHHEQRKIEFDAAMRSTIASERSRMMRDMHDGVGSQLVASLYSLRGDAVDACDAANLIDELLDDLRIAIDALEPSTQELLAPLGNLRYRLLPRLKQAGVTLDWEIADSVSQLRFAPESVLQSLRVVQEAIANCMKHAQATKICLRLYKPGARNLISPMAVIEIQDNGLGFNRFKEREHGHGRGLANMERRARDIGGKVEWQAEPGGTLVRLEVPALPLV